MRIKGISETKIRKYKPRISPRAKEPAEKQSQDWACCFSLSCVVSSAFCWPESSTHSLAAVSAVFLVSPPSQASSVLESVTDTYVTSTVCQNIQASYLTALGKEGFGKNQQLCRAMEEEQQWPASSLDRWFGPESLNTGINQETAKAGTLALLAPQRRSLNLLVPEKVIMFRENYSCGRE